MAFKALILLPNSDPFVKLGGPNGENSLYIPWQQGISAFQRRVRWKFSNRDGFARVSRRPSQFADRQQPVNCKLVSPNNALVAVGLTLDAVLERVSCYGEETNASRFGFREDAQ
jgi:hypothetical protein